MIMEPCRINCSEILFILFWNIKRNVTRFKLRRNKVLWRVFFIVRKRYKKVCLTVLSVSSLNHRSDSRLIEYNKSYNESGLLNFFLLFIDIINGL